MKIIITKIYEVDFDVEAEKKRLKSCFKGEQLKRQEDILNAFLNGEYQKMEDLYFNLPRYSNNKYPELEYVSLWYDRLSDPREVPDVKIELIKN